MVTQVNTILLPILCLFELVIDHKRPKGDQGSDKDQYGLFESDGTNEQGLKQESAENGE